MNHDYDFDITLINLMFTPINRANYNMHRNSNGFIELRKLKDPSYYKFKKNKQDD